MAEEELTAQDCPLSILQLNIQYKILFIYIKTLIKKLIYENVLGC